MPTNIDEWRALMRHGLQLVFPPIFGKFVEAEKNMGPAAHSIAKMEEAADQVHALACQLRESTGDGMGEELAEAAEEIAGSL